ncbi:imidazole glycerol phosphate synthase subunit HisH [Fulvivirga lutea]|uniref:Imidazole glycerol phosphate synthase subunit HisH n=1 Tax=Fulvivirga lutea TaxID=2810512 RepID=A0A974WHG1_9BACT|nr:imidazole glycerol phosphate synthase subunit HisH [Fulvivirga lutea]QSE96185.1 imidazole glycerol phosphate synthase subunit HisH [Fulvivirga lutea]
MKIAIIKYNAGNTQSVIFALNRLGINPTLTDNAEELQSADKVIFPGVGEAGSTMQHLRAKGLDTIIYNLKQPVLGICLGMQLLCKYSEEGNTKCIGVFNTEVKKLQSETLNVPHMGWNELKAKDHALNKQLIDKHMYFVHSYYVPITNETIASTTYGQEFSASLQKDNYYAVQFHPEKSSKQGLQMIKNFIEL